MRRVGFKMCAFRKLEDGELKILESFKFDEIKNEERSRVILDAMQVDKNYSGCYRGGKEMLI